MGISDEVDLEQQADATADEDVELLPLYHENPSADTDEPTLPDPKATPAEVRDYLFHLLRHRGLPPAQASTLAARWSNGTGRELRSYPISMYANIFGSDEDVWTVCMAVKTEIYKADKAKEPPRKFKIGMVLVFLALLCGQLGLFWIPDLNDGWLILFIVTTGITGVITVVLLIMACENDQPEDKAEKLLKAHYTPPLKVPNQTP